MNTGVIGELSQPGGLPYIEHLTMESDYFQADSVKMHKEIIGAIGVSGSSVRTIIPLQKRELYQLNSTVWNRRKYTSDNYPFSLYLPY
jgi:hypothetical protein